MEEKNQEIRKYIELQAESINEKYPNAIDNEDINKVLDFFLNSNDDLEIIHKNIDLVLNKILRIKNVSVQSESINKPVVEPPKVKMITPQNQNKSGFASTFSIIFVVLFIMGSVFMYINLIGK